MAAARSAVELLLQKLTDPLIRKAFIFYGVGEKVKSLEAEFRQMRPFLKYADDVEQEGDERVKKWAGEVKDAASNAEDVVEQDGVERVKKWAREVIDVAYDADNVVDTFVSKIETLRRRGFVGCIKRYAFFFDRLIGRRDVGSEMERIKNKIRSISERMSTFGIQNIGQGAGTSSAGLSHEKRIRTFPLTRDPDFVGYEDDLEGLVTRLTMGGLRRSVVSLVGRAGIGKTTLAKEVYNDTRVKNHFDSCTWISLSQQYGVRHPLEKIFEQLMEEKVTGMKVTQFYMDAISEYLKKKRYLMVLDYVCTKQTWDDLNGAFPDMKNGSRVMLTTRNKEVALYADNSRPHQLTLLNNENSLKLLCKKAFPGRDGYCPQDFEELGREIVEECDGLPLLIVITGRYLSMKEQTEWEKPREIITTFWRSDPWQFFDEEIEISDILCFSYKYMPYYLKSCILYMGNFPMAHELHTKELIRPWAAEGLVEERGEETIEEVGEEYLKELVKRGVVEVAGTSSRGGIKSCRIHPYLWYFSILEAEECKVSQVYSFSVHDPPASRARRLAIYGDSLSYLTNYNPHLRSVLIYSQFDTHPGREKKFRYRGFKLLRVLHLHGFQIKNLPTEVGKLIHLRYLRCNKTLLKSLPSSIANLPNLQTLHVTSTSDINIPSTILEMQQLRHLLVAGLDKVNYLGWMGNWGLIQGHPTLELISNLQTLSQVMPGKWIQGCLGKLTNLRKLGIALDTVADADVLYESIVKMDHLSSLSVVTLAHVNRTLGLLVPPLSHLLKLSKLRLEGKLDKLPESTEFPTNLIKLTLAYSCLNQDPMATLEKLRNLRILRLLGYSYVGVEMVCSAQGFPQLESLHLQGLFQLVEWRLEVGAMPNLLYLQISKCLNLKKLPEGLRLVNSLKKLELRNMPDDFKKGLREYWGEEWRESWHKLSIEA